MQDLRSGTYKFTIKNHSLHTLIKELKGFLICSYVYAMVNFYKDTILFYMTGRGTFTCIIDNEVQAILPDLWFYIPVNLV